MIYNIGFIFALTLIIISIDDILWNLYYLFLKLTKKTFIDEISIKDLNDTVPGLLALIMAAYKEDDVLESVVENIIKSQEYPASMYHIFIGVYPNDLKTKAIAEKLAKKYQNIHSITHVLNGPSSKADNINNVIENIYKYETAHNLQFKGIIIHDSEDIVHPYEFLLENYLFESKPAIQIPVFPLIEMPTWSNFFKNMVTSTYADEFAEHHVRNLHSRNAAKAFVASAGTGFALRRDVLESFFDSNVFPVGSLTEDFKLSLQLKEKGFDLYYPLKKVVRLNYKNEIKNEYIATRSMFPKTYKAAVRQKTRWIYGITMQSFRMRDVIKSKNLRLRTKYTLYKDWKAKYLNLLVLPGYLIFAYFVLSFFLDIPVMFPYNTPAWYMAVALTILMVYRQVLRFTAVNRVYGLKSAFFSTLVLPIVPIRVAMGNFINFHATVNAWKMRFFKPKTVSVKKAKTPSKPLWTKTDHEFLEEEVLVRFNRTLGDDLIKKELISPEYLNKAVKVAMKNNVFLGKALINLGSISEEEVIRSISTIQNRQFINKAIGNFKPANMPVFQKEYFTKARAIPIFQDEYKITILTSVDYQLDEVREKVLKPFEIVYCTEAILKESLNPNLKSNYVEINLYIIEQLIKEKLITTMQGIIAINYTSEHDSVEETLKKMGLLKNIIT